MLENNYIKLNKFEDKKISVVNAYKIINSTKELENETTLRYNFHLLPEFHFLTELNIKLNIKNKEEKDILLELNKKVKTTISENNFMKEAILILKNIDNKIDLNIIPIIYSNKLIYRVTLNNNLIGTITNENMNTIELLKFFNVYKYHEKSINFILNSDLKNKDNKEMLKKILEIESGNKIKITKEDIKKIVEVNKCKTSEIYKIFKDEVYEEIKDNKYYKILSNRNKYYSIYIKKDRDNLSKLCIKKWLDEFCDENIIKDPYTFDAIFNIEFKDLDIKYKEFIEKTENIFKKIWTAYENKINLILKSKIKIAIKSYDLFLNKLEITIIYKDKMINDYIYLDNIKGSLIKILGNIKKQ